MKTFKFKSRFLILFVGLLTMCVTQVWGEDVEITTSIYEGKGGASGTGGNATNTYQGVTLTSTKAYYTAAHIREYSGTMTISSTSTITKIVVTCTSNAYATAFSGATPTSGGGTYSTSSTIGTWQPKAGDAATKTVTFTHSAQTRWSKIVVTLASACTEPATALSITSAATATVGTPLSLTSTGGNGGTVTWSVTNGTGSATVDGSTLTPLTAGTVTVKAHQDQNGTTCEQDAEKVVTISKQATTITLSEAGKESNVSGTHYVGDSYTLPSTTSATCGSKVLVGWSTVVISTPGAKPVSNYYEKGASVTLGATNKFYAVFATASAGGAEPSAYTVGATGDYVLAIYNGESWYAIPTSPTVSSGKITGVEITVNTSASSVNYVTTANASGFTWTIANATNGQTISDGTKYLYHSNGGSSGTNLTYNTGTTYTWTIEQEAKGLTFKGTNGSTVNTRGMLASGTTFGGYALSNEDASGYYRIQVLPIGGGSTYTDYITECSSDPSVSASVASVTGLDYITGHGPSTAKTFTVGGSNLTANVTVSVSGSDFEISKSENSGYGSSLTFTQAAGSVSAQTVYVRLKSGKSAGNYNSTITVSSTNADDASVTLSGTVTDPTPVLTVTPTTLTFDKVVKNPGSPQQKTFTLSGTDLTANASLAISGAGAAMFSVDKNTVTKNGSGAIAATTITVTYSPTATGSHSATLTVSSTGASNKTVTLSGTCANKYTVTWSVYGDESRTTEVWAGDAVVLPSTPGGLCVNDGHNYNSFYGWYTAETTNPAATPVGTKVTASTVPTDDVTYYAVYKATWTDPGAGTSWQLMSDLNVTAGTYAIICSSTSYAATYQNQAFNGTITSVSNYDGGATTATFSFTKNVASSAPDGTCEVQLIEVGTPGSNQYVIYNSSKGYLYNGSGGRKLSWQATTTYWSGEINSKPVEKGYWFNNNGNWAFRYGNTVADNVYLRSYNTKESGFRGYTSASNGPIAFVKKVAGGEVTKYLSSCCTKHAVNISGSIEHGTVTASPTSACADETVTLTARPDGGYVFDSWNVRDASSNTVTVTDNAFTMPNSAVTVSATFVAAPSYNVTWSVNGETNVVPVVQNNPLVLPSPAPTSPCPGKVFVGWTTHEGYEHATTEPNDLFSVAGDKTVTDNVTYYAVFAEASGADIIVDANFNENTNKYGFPTEDGTVSGSYILDGRTFVFSMPSVIKLTNNASRHQLTIGSVASGGSTGTIKTPAISGYKLTQVTITSDAGSGENAKLSICYDDYHDMTISGGEEKTYSKSTPMTWNLSETSSNTAYDIVLSGTNASAKNVQLAGLYAKFVSTGAVSYSNYVTTCDTRYNINKVEDGCSINVTNGNKENYGQTVTFTVAVNPGYSIGAVTVTGASGSVDVTNNAGTYSFTMPDEDVTIDAGCTCNTYTVDNEWIDGAGTYIESDKAQSDSYRYCAVTETPISYHIKIKDAQLGHGYTVELSVTRGGSPWDGYTYDPVSGLFTIAAGQLTGNVVVNISRGVSDFSVTKQPTPAEGGTIQLYKTDGTEYGATIPAGSTVYMDATANTANGYYFVNENDAWVVAEAARPLVEAADINGPALSGANVGRYYFTMPPMDVIVMAGFETCTDPNLGLRRMVFGDGELDNFDLNSIQRSESAGAITYSCDDHTNVEINGSEILVVTNGTYTIHMSIAADDVNHYCADEKDVTIKVLPGLVTPDGLYVDNLTNGGHATFHWSDNNTNETGYQVIVVDGEGNETLSAVTAANATSVEMSGLTTCADYTWYVVAVGDGENYGYSNRQTTPGEFTLPGDNIAWFELRNCHLNTGAANYYRFYNITTTGTTQYAYANVCAGETLDVYIDGNAGYSLPATATRYRYINSVEQPSPASKPIDYQNGVLHAPMQNDLTTGHMAKFVVEAVVLTETTLSFAQDEIFVTLAEIGYSGYEFPKATTNSGAEITYSLTTNPNDAGVLGSNPKRLFTVMEGTYVITAHVDRTATHTAKDATLTVHVGGYQLFYNGNGGTIIPSGDGVYITGNSAVYSGSDVYPYAIVTAGATVNMRILSRPAGKVLDRWTSNAASFTGNTFTMPSQKTVVSAVWVNGDGYFVTVYVNAEDPEERFGCSYTVGSQDNICELPTRAGYHLKGFYTAASSGAKVFNADGSMILNVAGYTDGSGWSRTSDATLYAQWTTESEFTITYNMNGGENEVGAPTTFFHSDLNVTLPANPTKTGYDFGGWYTNSGLTEGPVNQITTDGSKTYWAKWNAQTYNITYKDRGNTAFSGTFDGSQPTTHTYGTATPLVAPTKDCYDFGGWYYDYMGGTAKTEVGATDKEADFTLFAEWTLARTDVTVYANNETDEYMVCPVAIGSSANCCYAPTYVGYALDGFYTAAVGGVKVYNADGTMVLNNNPYTNGSGWAYTNPTLNLYAHWSANSFTLTWNADGGVIPNTPDYSKGELKYRQPITPPADPTRTGYVFAGWDTDIPATMPNNDLTITATWVPDNYDINCEIWNGGVKLQDCGGVASVAFGTANVDVEVSTACITGYTISSWTITPTTAYTSVDDRTIRITSMPASDITVKVNVTPAQYTITLDKNNGVEDKSVTATYLSNALSPANFAQTSRAGYTIGGYTTVADGNVLVIGTDKKLVANVDGYTDAEGRWIRTENTTLYAKWIPNTRNITYYDGDAIYTGAWASDPHPTTYLEGIGCALVEAVKTGYTFVGWYRNSDLSGTKTTSIGTSIKGDQTFYAKWTANNYTVVLNANYTGATEANNGSITVTYGTRTVVNYKAATRTGYTLKPTNAYNTTSAGTGTYIVTDGGVLTENNHGSWLAGDDHHWVATSGTLYAQWNKNKYNLTWVTDGDALTGSYTKGSVYYEAGITAPNTPTKTGYIFAGWDAAVPATMPANDVTLTATWTPISYTVVYDGNGKTGGSMSNQSFNYGQARNLLANNYTRDGYRFTGWNTMANGLGTPYTNQQNVSNLTSTNGATVTLYAQWELQFGTMTISGDVHLTTGNGIQVYTTTEANNLITLSCDNLGAANSFKIEYLDEGDQVIAKGSSLFRLCYAPGYEQGNSAYTVADGSNIPLSPAEKGAVSYSRKFAISYTPNAAGVTNRWKLRLTAMTSGNAELASQTITLNGRSLPSEFVIATKINGEWYALRSDMSSSSENSTPLQGAKIEVNNTTTPTIATYAPQNARYTTAARNAPQSYRGAVRLQSVQTNGYLQATESDAANIWLPTTNNTKGMQDWYLSSTNFGVYNIDLYPRDNEGNLIAHGRALSVRDGNIGWYTTQTKTFYLLPIDPETEFGPMLDIVDWSSSSVTVNMSNSTRTLTMGAVTKTKLQRETDRTMVLTSASPLNAGDLVLISGVNATSSALETKHKYKVPYICTGSTTISAKTGFDGSTTLYVKDGVTTVSAQIEIAKVIVCPGAALNVTGRIRCGELIIRTTPWESGSVEGDIVTANTYYTRIIAKQDAYYHFALPYESNVDNVFLSNHSNAPYGNTWILKSYNGARRANSGADGQNWTLLDGTSNKTIAATTGYEMFSNSGYYREFYFPVTPTANKSVSLVAHSGSASEAHKGWNAVCSPIMSNYQPTFSQPSEALKISELVDLDVYWQHIPTWIVPAIPFYVQTETDKTLLFDNSSWNSPARVVEEEVAEQWLQLNYTPATGRGDETNIFVHPNFTAAYETGKDVAKQTLTGKYPVVYVSLACGNLAFAAVPDDLAADRIPLTVYAPQTAEMTFSLADNTYLDRLESLYLVDEQDGAMIDLLTSDYTYSAEQGTTSGRFYLVAVFRAPQVPTDWQGADGGETDVKKIIYKDHMYILRDGHIWDANGKRVK